MAYKKNFSNGDIVKVIVDGESYAGQYLGRDWLFWGKRHVRVYFLGYYGEGIYTEMLFDIDDICLPTGMALK